MTAKVALMARIPARVGIGGIIRSVLPPCHGLRQKSRATVRAMAGSRMFCTAMIGMQALRQPTSPMVARAMWGR